MAGIQQREAVITRMKPESIGLRCEYGGGRQECLEGKLETCGSVKRKSGERKRECSEGKQKFGGGLHESNKGIQESRIQRSQAKGE